MKISHKIIAAILLITGSSGAVYAYSKHGGWHMTPEDKVEFISERVSKKLELDAGQKQNFTELAEMVAQLLADARAGRQQQLAEVQELLQQPSFNQARALEILQQKTQLFNEKAPAVIASLAVFLDSLNSGQKRQLQEFIEHHHQHRRHGHSGHGDDG